MFKGLRCTECHKQGHTPYTIALDPVLFDCEVTVGETTFNKKQGRVISAKINVCRGSGDIFYESEARRARLEYAEADRARTAKEQRRRGLVANLKEATSPMTDAFGTLEQIESLASQWLFPTQAPHTSRPAFLWLVCHGECPRRVTEYGSGWALWRIIRQAAGSCTRHLIWAAMRCRPGSC